MHIEGQLQTAKPRKGENWTAAGFVATNWHWRLGRREAE
jgi:hypothetical protein